MHEHFDADGNKTGFTIVARESVWDDESRGRALRLAEFEAAQCYCGSGLTVAECTKDQPFLVDHVVHYGLRAIEKVTRSHDADAKREKRADGWNDGYRYYVKVHNPDEGRSRGD